MTNEERMAYVAGFLEATAGSVNDYTTDELRSKMRFVASILRSDEKDWKHVDSMGRVISLDKLQ